MKTSFPPAKLNSDAIHNNWTVKSEQLPQAVQDFADLLVRIVMSEIGHYPNVIELKITTDD